MTFEEYLSLDGSTLDEEVAALDCIDVEVVDRRRWYYYQQLVFEVDGRFLGVLQALPNSETQEGGDFPDSEAYEVWPRTTVCFRQDPK